jgi:hypothetical protein
MLDKLDTLVLEDGSVCSTPQWSNTLKKRHRVKGRRRTCVVLEVI